MAPKKPAVLKALKRAGVNSIGEIETRGAKATAAALIKAGHLEAHYAGNSVRRVKLAKILKILTPADFAPD